MLLLPDKQTTKPGILAKSSAVSKVRMNRKAVTFFNLLSVKKKKNVHEFITSNHHFTTQTLKKKSMESSILRH